MLWAQIKKIRRVIGQVQNARVRINEAIVISPSEGSGTGGGYTGDEEETSVEAEKEIQKLALRDVENTSSFDELLIEPVKKGCNKIYIVSGYATSAMAFHHLEEINKINDCINIELIIGMCPSDGLALSNHRGFQQIMEYDFRDSFRCSYIINFPPVHAKVYSWFRDDKPCIGFLGSANYDDELALNIETTFNEKYSNVDDEFSPVMNRLRNDSIMAGYFDYIDSFVGIIIFVFILAMSIVLWNTGLIGGLRRYGEIGVRIAIGEQKGHVYRSMIFEAIYIGLIGSILGTLIGLGFSYWVQEVGIDVSGIMKNSKMMMPSVFRSNITTPAYYIGFIPGLFSIVLGTMLSGIGIYKRKTAQLFKELET